MSMRGIALVLGTLALAACTRESNKPFDFDFDASFHYDAPVNNTNPDGGVPDASEVLPDATIDPCRASDSGVAVTIGQACATSEDCNDQCFCNGGEICQGNVCVAGTTPCSDEVDCTAEACLEELDRCFYEPIHSMCSNGDACDGTELCDTRQGCIPGSPLYCSDEDTCTVDSCDTAMGCVFASRDLDRDGYADGRCGGEDCDDNPHTGVDIHPGGTENCTNRRDDNCDGLRDFNDTSCVATNDVCSGAQVIMAEGTYSGATRSLNADYTLSCSTAGPDAVFKLVLTETTDVRVTAAGAANSAIAVRDFAQCASGSELKCNSGFNPSAFIRSLPAGEYAIIVKTATSSIFDLQVRLDDATPVQLIDRCASDTVQIPNDATTTLRGNFEDTGADYVPSCRSGGGVAAFRDAVYRISTTSAKDITITASTTNSSGGTPPTFLTLVSSCSDITNSTLACLTETAPRIRRRALPAGEYFLIIESGAADAASWSITATIEDPVSPQPGDACSTALDLDLTSGTATTSFAMFEREAGTSCGGTAGSFRDGFFTFEIDETRDVSINTTSAAGGSYFVSLQTTCGVTGSDLRCRSVSTGDTQLFRSLPAGRYYFTVATTGTGNYSVTVTTDTPTPVPQNDRCDGAISLNDALSGPVYRRDTLVDFADDVAGGSCAPSGAPESFYTFTLASRTRVNITATRIGSSTSPMYLTLRSGGCAIGSGVTDSACVASTSAVGASATVVRTLEPGTYYLLAEQASAALSDFDLDVTMMVLATPDGGVGDAGSSADAGAPDAT